MAARDSCIDDGQNMTLLIKTMVESTSKAVALLERLEKSKMKMPESQEIYKSKQQSNISNHLETDKEDHKIVQNASSSSYHHGVQEDGRKATYYPGKNDELLKMIFSSDWEKAKMFLDETNSEAFKEALDEDLFTPLHTTIYNRCVDDRIKEEIVKRTPSDVLEYKTKTGNTALHLSAVDGDTKAAVLIVRKNWELLQIRDSKGRLPIELALEHVTIGQKAIVRYLYYQMTSVHQYTFSGKEGVRILSKAINADFYDIASSLVQCFPELIAQPREDGKCALDLIVQRPFAFGSGGKLEWWQQLIYSCIRVDITSIHVRRLEQGDDHTTLDVTGGEESEESSKVSTTTFSHRPTKISFISKLSNQKMMHKQASELVSHMLVKGNQRTLKENPNVIKVAMKHGIIEFVEEFLSKFGNLAAEPISTISGERMIEIAIKERNERLVNLICKTYDHFDYKMGTLCKVDYYDNTILHHAAKLAPTAQLILVSGAVFQMQRELQWLKGVEGMISETDKFKINKDGDTAQAIFTREHKELLKTGQEWMKDMSGSCMVVAALITTVSFAACFTIPGGNFSDSESAKKGTPFFLGAGSLATFLVADTVALFSSIASVLMFLAMYTSRYAEEDFLKSLPRKIIIGLTTLFISLVSILVAFCASMFIVVGSKYKWALIPIALFGSINVALFALLQLPLLYQMVRSTYWGSYFQKHRFIDSMAGKSDKRRKSL